jgi:hypothetical protein
MEDASMNRPREFKTYLSVAIALVTLVALPAYASDGWVPLFDGKTLNGWRPSESKSSWQIIDGALVAKGPRSHLFYEGDVQNHNFKNFEFSADVKTMTAANSGIYFHTEYQEEGWPVKGYECQVINSYYDVEPGEYIEKKMTGSLYALRNVWKSPVRDHEWFNYRIVVQGRTIRAYINGELMTEYTEPDNPHRLGMVQGSYLASDTFALQCHDPESVVYYKNIKVKPLPDDLPTPGVALEDSEFAARLVDIAERDFPLMDLHAHLKGGLTMERALENGRKYGITYGFAVNCGLGMGFETNEALQKYLDTYRKPPHTFLAMQAEGREWQELFSKKTIAQFDYVFTDAMTWTNDDGKRIRLWIKEETEVGNQQEFMEQLVSQIESIVRNEPIDIYVNPTYLPEEISGKYDELWTADRMDRVIKALVESDVALEINDRFKIPGPSFIKRAKAAGVKFTFGTNNSGADDLGRLDYCTSMIFECDLSAEEMWIPNLKR